MVALRAIGVSKVFDDGFKALSDIDLSVERGEFLTLLGPSGCGKTTLLKTFAGFHPPTTGRIELGGEDVTDAPPERRDTAMCFQSYALFPHLTVSENIEFGPRQNGVARDTRLKRLDDLLRQVDLEAHREKLPNKLSGGQQQRVALARALAMQPSVVLFDEPLSNLDAKLREQVRREIRALQRDLGFTAIYVTHDQVEALAMSDTVVVMRAGQIDQVGAPEEVYAKPATAFVADFIGAANLLPFTRVSNREVDTALGRMIVATAPGPDDKYLCWRPEEALIGDGAGHSPPDGADPDQANGTANGGQYGYRVNLVRAKVRERAFQGSFTELHVTAGSAPDQRLHVQGGGADLGAEIAFRLPPDRIRFVTGEPG